MKQILTIVLIVLIAGAAWYFLFGSKTTIEDMRAHFQESGLVVADLQLTAEEQRTVDEGKKAVEAISNAVGAGDSDVAESKTLILNSIQVKVRRYESQSKAREAHELFGRLQTSRKERAERSNSEYFRAEAHINKTYLLQVDHYDVDASLRPTTININPTDLNKIITAFKSF